MSEEIKETPNGELTQGEFKIKKKPKKFVSETKITKIDLSKKEDKTKEPTEDLVKQEEETNKEVVEAKVEEVLDIADTKIEETKIEETKLEEIKQEEAKDLEETKDIVEDIKEEITDDEDNWEYTEEAKDTYVEGRKQEVRDDPMAHLQDWGMADRIGDFIDEDGFIDDVISSDGRGHTLSSYDGEEGELVYDNEWYYIYRTN